MIGLLKRVHRDTGGVNCVASAEDTTQWKMLDIKRLDVYESSCGEAIEQCRWEESYSGERFVKRSRILYQKEVDSRRDWGNETGRGGNPSQYTSKTGHAASDLQLTHFK